MDAIYPYWTSGRVPRGFWHDFENHRHYMRWLGRRLGFRKTEDWYRVCVRHFTANHGGGFLVGNYGGSAVAAVKANFPLYDWKDWLFTSVPYGFWNSKKNRRRYLDWLALQLGYRSPDDWYQVRMADFRKHSCGKLLSIYRESPVRLIMEHYPEYDWLPWRFVQVPAGFWRRRANRLRFLHWYAELKGYTCPEDWYQLTEQEMHAARGKGVWQAQSRGALGVARTVYPDYDWKPWLFRKVPDGFWDRRPNRRKFLDWLGKQLCYRRANCWYGVTREEFEEHGGLGMLRLHYRSYPALAVMDCYANLDWRPDNFRYLPSDFWESRKNQRTYQQCS